MKYVLSIYLPGLLLGSFALGSVINSGLWVYTLLGWVLVSGLGIAVGFHRVFSHKTHDVRPWLDNLLLFLGSLGGQGSSISWVAVHRGYHHRHSDTERDLHSPTKGFWHSVIGWYWALGPETINHKFAVELFRRPWHVRVHKHYIKWIWAWSASLLVLDHRAFLIYMSVLFLSLVQDNLVNSLCHLKKLGYTNFDTRDNSINFWPLGYLGWGQGWHSNHHARPASFDFGYRWWELDPCKMFLPLLHLGSRPTKVKDV